MSCQKAMKEIKAKSPIKGVANLLESENRSPMQKSRVHKKSKKSTPARTEYRIASVSTGPKVKTCLLHRMSLNLTLETKLESIDLRMSKMEKNQRILKKKAKKIEERLTSIESKVNEEKNKGEDMDFGQWDHGDYGTKTKYKDNSDDGQQEGSEQEDSATLNQLKERCLAQADDLWRKIEESEESEDQEKVGGKEAETSEEEIENRAAYRECALGATNVRTGTGHQANPTAVTDSIK
ncbi:hypothetical protein Bca52824_032838 [Brassica carinata]|uniref:Uncharacterized protein n=1 Tax=Brassica carinata TaxID=52824 RepID=A0A8X7V6P6_BRACI|nr:hypothetical protein Bca52824_032838 [Brassica carinata]